ncbi:MAG: GAF domain-containing protein, partial [Coleofasciculus sp. S288]|nr:GAF domain-containing protein [Coleofasciculus sp. S288]
MTTAEPNKVEPLTGEQTAGVAVHSSPNLLHGVAQATNQLLRTDDLATAINQALTTLGQVMGVDRVYIFEIHSHPDTVEPAMSQRFEWARETVTAEIDNPRLQNLCFAACGMSHWYEALLAGNYCSGLVRDLAPLERQLLEPQGILSILVVPIPVNGKLWGFIGFDDCHCDRKWSKDESAVLMTMAATIGVCIAQRQTEDALRQSQLRLEKIAANVPGMIFQFLQRPDGSRSVLYASSGCRELYELEPEDIKADVQVLFDLTHPEDRAAFEQSVITSAATGDTWKWEGRIVTPSGKLKWVQGASRLERQSNGELLWDGLVTDLTDRKQAEEALRQSEARNRALLNALPDLIFRVARDGTYLDCHAENASDLVIPASELIGKKCDEVLPAPVAQLCMQHIAQALSTGVIQTLEYQLPLQGNPYYWETRIVVSGADEVLVIVRNITNRKRAEEELQLSAERDRLLGEIALRIRQSLDLEQILQTTVTEVRQFLGCDRVFFTHIDEQLKGEVSVESVDPNWGSVLGILRNNPTYIKEIKAVFASGNVQVINDTTRTQVSPLRAHYFAEYQVKACLAVPIMVNN